MRLETSPAPTVENAAISQRDVGVAVAEWVLVLGLKVVVA